MTVKFVGWYASLENGTVYPWQSHCKTAEGTEREFVRIWRDVFASDPNMEDFHIYPAKEQERAFEDAELWARDNHTLELEPYKFHENMCHLWPHEDRMRAYAKDIGKSAAFVQQMFNAWMGVQADKHGDTEPDYTAFRQFIAAFA